MSFTLKDVEKCFFSMDEQSARDKALTKIALGHAPVENQIFVTIAVSLDISLQIVLIQNKTSSMTTQ